jgi:hypothetical protein
VTFRKLPTFSLPGVVDMDTLGQFVGINGDYENNAGDAL